MTLKCSLTAVLGALFRTLFERIHKRVKHGKTDSGEEQHEKQRK